MTCQYCNKEVKNKNSKTQHELRCKDNPNVRVDLRELFLKCRSIPWNKGLTKETDIRMKNLSKSVSETFKNNGIKPIGISSTIKLENERRKRISNTMKKNGISGGLREGSGRGVKTWYNSPIAGRVYLRSTYELKYAKWLDKNNINWKQNLKSFEYKFQNKIRKYYPDFYLVNEDCYIEIKGFKTKQDEAKWKYFPNKLKILYKEDLEKL